MDATWLLVIVILLVLFASISVIGALRRIADATERSAALLETLVSTSRDEVKP
jgi:HAMP domain-containing protein